MAGDERSVRNMVLEFWLDQIKSSPTNFRKWTYLWAVPNLSWPKSINSTKLGFLDSQVPVMVNGDTNAEVWNKISRRYARGWVALGSQERLVDHFEILRGSVFKYRFRHFRIFEIPNIWEEGDCLFW